ncbi:hypothetical protein PWT90_03953 [Aphanocladium album]|nr:hypothetical protein PWT90_03953 [Aphanocladium album]
MAAGFAEAPSCLGMESGVQMMGTVQGLPTPENSSPNSQPDLGIPALDAVLDLVDVFYEKFYSSMPVMHKGKLVSRLQTQGVDGIPQLLLLSIITVASSGHPNLQIRANQSHWRGLAREALKKSILTEEHPLQTLQAALLLIFDSLAQGDYAITWMMLGETWRKAAVIGYHQVDARDNETVVQYLGSVSGLDWIELEECRRVVWMFFIFDRGLCYPIGMVHAVDERRLIINFPMSEDEFQSAQEPNVERPILKYANDIDRLIKRVQEHGRKKASTLLHYIILAYVLLGRVTEEVFMQDAEDDKCAALDALIEKLVHIRLILPCCASDLSLAKPGDVPYIVWLGAVMSTCTIFLHHRALHREEGESNSTDVLAKWPHAVTTARNMVQLLRDAYRSGASSTFLLSHTTASLFVSTRVLIMEYICPGYALTDEQLPAPGKLDKAIRSDLQVLASVSMQAPSGLGALGQKFIIGFKFHVRMSEQDIRASKEYGAKGLLKRCGDWALADDGEDILVPE